MPLLTGALPGITCLKTIKMSKLSVAIVTLNNEKTIQDCLSSVSFADEIIIVDGESSDRTIVLCHPFTEKILVRPFVDYASQVQYALQNCHNEWVLVLFADERVRPELATEITDLMTRPVNVEGFFIARRSYFMNKWIRFCGMYPDYRLRLARRDAVQAGGTRTQGILHCNGSAGKLRYDLDFNAYPTLFDSIAAMNRRTTREARVMAAATRVNCCHFIFPPLAIFLKKYIIQQGFRAGGRGFLLSWYFSFHKMVVYMKTWLLQHPLLPGAGGSR